PRRSSPITVGACPIGSCQTSAVRSVQCLIFEVEIPFCKLQHAGCGRHLRSSLLCQRTRLPPFGSTSDVLYTSYSRAGPCSGKLLGRPCHRPENGTFRRAVRRG